jgi:putative membrane protein
MHDLMLAVLHHLLIFGLFGILIVEMIAVRRGMTNDTVARIAAVDVWYGVLSGLILLVGFSRALFAAKGWAYYSSNTFFWAKVGTFAVIGVLSVLPTMAFIRWRRAGVAPSDAEVSAVRQFIHVELVLFALLLVFAATMARGYGSF